MNIGDRIRDLRNKRNFTQDELGEILEMGRTNLANYENGSIVPPTKVLIKLADVFKVSIDYLLGRAENPHETFKDMSEEAQAREEKLRGYLAASEKLFRNGKDVDEKKLKEALNYMEYLFKKDDDEEKPKD